MRKIITVVSILACTTPVHAHADTTDELNAWDTFVNTNDLLAHMQQMRTEMRIELQRLRTQQMYQQSQPAPAYVPEALPRARAYDPDHDCAKCAPILKGFKLD